MAVKIISKSTKLFALLLVLLSYSPNAVLVRSVTIIASTEDLLFAFALNFDYCTAEYLLHGALGFGLDEVAPNLVDGGPSPIGASVANLSPLVKDIFSQIGYQYVGRIRAIKRTVINGGIARPLVNISSATFAEFMDNAFGRQLVPPFDPYANDTNFLLASYFFPYIGLTGLVNANALLLTPAAKTLGARILSIDAGQDAIIRTLLYERRDEIVTPYDGVSVAEFTNRISDLRNRLGKEGVKDEGLVVPIEQGAEGRVTGNVLSANNDSLSYDRSPQALLRIVYGTGNESVPGGFFPNGASGVLADSFRLL
ncbi:hypothetical protein HN51_065448 [Arachis hypogaea]|uniref:Desiccation-related protein n=1 Tax=Arachis hypogaea TaxID=3818 RepID=A0A444ZEL8_ARAHY|nr:desiccation-related protein PCC13-62-like [Arachis ipaensis]XP_025644828.1 desiccation-related protein PCC13-62-like [Arachis hypogaea]QHO06591.1 Desiccation-related protein [Arachis hypogaea]RYR12594.1 hypothetical protein Ahy_B04g070062 [Arachis hypogaea]